MRTNEARKEMSKESRLFDALSLFSLHSAVMTAAAGSTTPAQARAATVYTMHEMGVRMAHGDWGKPLRRPRSSHASDSSRHYS